MRSLLLPLLLALQAPASAQTAADDRAYAQQEFDRFVAPAPDKICLFLPDAARRGSPHSRETAAAAEVVLRSMFERLIKENGLPTLICPDGIVLGGTSSGATLDQIGYAVIFAMGSDLLSELHDDGELAFVMAHELAHSVLRHYDAKYAAAKELDAIPDNLGSRLSHGADLQGHKIREFMARRRRMELEADRLGLALAAKAGYDLSGAAAYFERGAKTYSPSQDPRYDSHPSPSERARAARARQTELGPSAKNAPGGELEAIKRLLKR